MIITWHGNPLYTKNGAGNREVLDKMNVRPCTGFRVRVEAKLGFSCGFFRFNPFSFLPFFPLLLPSPSNIVNTY